MAQVRATFRVPLLLPEHWAYTLEARNNFYGLETTGLMRFQVLNFKKFDELREMYIVRGATFEIVLPLF
jgi:hypothetical protein